MAIEIGSFFGGICNSFYFATGLNNIFISITYTSILLSGIIILIIMLIYPCKKNTPLWRLLKVFLYISTASVIILSIHSSFMKNKYKETYLNSNVDKFMDNIHGGAFYTDDKIKVKPHFESSSRFEDDTESQIKNEPRNHSLSEIIDDIESKI